MAYGTVFSSRRLLRVWTSLLLGLAVLLGATSVHAHGEQGTDLLHHVGFDQKLDAQVPLDLVFRDETGSTVRLGDYFRDKPVILLLGYYECPNLCSLVNEGLAHSLRPINFNPGEDFEIVSVSIDPRETPAIAAEKKIEYLQEYNRAGADKAWHFLTGDEEQIQQLTEAVGFRYAYDEDIQQYAHASGLTILTPTGRVARYLYGIVYPAIDLRLGLVEASANQIGSPVEQVLLLCYQYDAMAGTYTPVVMNIIRLGGVVTVAAIGIFLVVMFRRERRPQQAQV